MHDVIRTVVAQRVKAARAHSGLRQIELAELCGVTLRAVQFWESGERVPGLDDLCKVAIYTDTSLGFLLSPLDDRREEIARGS